MPLIGAVLAIGFDHAKRPNPIRAMGLMFGFGTVIALAGVDVGGRGDELLGTDAILLAAVGYAGRRCSAAGHCARGSGPPDRMKVG